MPIRLLVFDIDGVLTEGEAKSLDLDLLKRLAAMNQAARQDSSRPAVTLCTGRPAPYVEVMLQAIDGHLPAIFENGAGMYVPESYRFLPHPDLSHLDHLDEIRHRLDEGMVARGHAYFQPGKVYTLTLFATDPADTPRLHEGATDALGSLRDIVDFTYSSSCLNILPRGIDKGKGLAFLAELSDYAVEDMLGVGDSDVDLEFLAMTGFSAAPSNANDEAKQIVQFVSQQPTADGVRDILDHFGISR